MCVTVPHHERRTAWNEGRSQSKEDSGDGHGEGEAGAHHSAVRPTSRQVH